jgi:hypothetical protein
MSQEEIAALEVALVVADAYYAVRIKTLAAAANDARDAALTLATARAERDAACAAREAARAALDAARMKYLLRI